MSDQFMLTPFYIDKPEPGLLPLAEEGWQINQPAVLPGESKQERMVYLYQPLVDFVAETAVSGYRSVSVAGDCCTSLAVLAGLQRAHVNPTLIWLDAHGDFNTWETTPSGFLGGMPLAMAVGRGEQTIVAGVGLVPLPAEQVILTDARDLDPGEREAVADSPLTHLPHLSDLLYHPLPQGPLYVHFDVDVLNPETAPAMNYPAPGGPDAAALGRVFDRLAGTGRIAAVSLSAWNPEMDENGRTQQVVLALLDRLLAAPGGK